MLNEQQHKEEYEFHVDNINHIDLKYLKYQKWPISYHNSAIRPVNIEWILFTTYYPFYEFDIWYVESFDYLLSILYNLHSFNSNQFFNLEMIVFTIKDESYWSKSKVAKGTVWHMKTISMCNIALALASAFLVSNDIVMPLSAVSSFPILQVSSERCDVQLHLHKYQLISWMQAISLDWYGGNIEYHYVELMQN